MEEKATEVTEATEVTQTTETTEAAKEEAAAITGEQPAAEVAAEAAKAEAPAEGEEGAALTGEGQPAEDAIDWEKITDDEYIAKIPLPEGQEWNKDVMGEYAKLLRENKIDPKVFAKFVEKDAQMQKMRGEVTRREQEKKQFEAKKAFREAGEEFRKEYTPEQVKEMNATLSKIDDPTFRTLVAKSPLANNKTMGKMLLAYEQVYGEAKERGGGAGNGGEKTFEQVWTGK